MYAVTIAMPLYNAEAYLNDTMQSALNQTFGNIEFLIIDDKGTDHSVAIIQKMQQEHPRGKDIRIVSHEKNRGVAAARNTALREAQGEFLFFLDSDDLITENCIELLYNATEREHAEVVFASHQEVWENPAKPKVDFVLPSLVLNGADQLAMYANQNLHQTLPSFVWNVLYRTSFVRASGVTFQPVNVWEDLLFSVDLVPLVKRAVLLPDITYIYIKREGSLSQYHARKAIPQKEIREHIQIREYCKARCLTLTGKPYFEKLITKTMKICLDTAAVAIDKRKMFVPPLPTAEIKKLLKHPLHLSGTLRMKEYKPFNTGICLLGNLPVAVLTVLLCIYTRMLKAYRNRNKR